MKIISDINQIDPARWRAFIRVHPDGNFFQSPEIFELYSKTTGYDPFIWFATEHENIYGVLLAVRIREKGFFSGLLSARTIVTGGPLVDDNCPGKEGVISQLISSLVEKTKGNSVYVQFRNLFSMEKEKDVFLSMGFGWTPHLNYHIPVTSGDELLYKMSRSKRRQIRKSLANGAEIIEAENLQQVWCFYKILRKLYQTKVRKPMPDWSFFETFYRKDQKQNFGRILLITYQNEIVGGVVCPITPGRTIYEWYIGGLDKKFRGVHPSVLATWAPLDYALKNGIQTFDLLGVGKPDQNYGVRTFKQGFGGELINYGRYDRINDKWRYLIGKTGLQLWELLRH